MTAPHTPDPSRADREAAEAYLKRVPFTIAGFGRQEVDLILFAYRNAFLSGAQHGRAAERARCAEIADKLKERYQEIAKSAERQNEPGIQFDNLANADIAEYVAYAIRSGGEPEGKE
jgi:acyl-CoA reductase-like NAD-dependent aldehyde dehydrogenase